MSCVNDMIFHSFLSPPCDSRRSDGCGRGDTSSTPLAGCRTGNTSGVPRDVVPCPHVGVEQANDLRIIGREQPTIEQEGGCIFAEVERILALQVGAPEQRSSPSYKDLSSQVNSHCSHRLSSVTTHSTKSQYAHYGDCDKLFDMMDMYMDIVYATRTPPANSNKYKKRLGAKASKNLEKLESVGFELNSKEATLYRALSARCNYLAQDRVDVAFAAKELCREFAVPTRSSYARLKRLARYLVGTPRLV